MPSYCAYIDDQHVKLHPFDTEPIRAASREEAMKIVMGGSLWLSPEESRQVETMELVRRFDEQAIAEEHPELKRGDVFELVQEWLTTVDEYFH
jgi:hypothetical protein